ncbi:hypothetical protein A8C32_15660 [Flavivirga aquatica]|uniref:TIGR00341 family protein n=1 Tax=Flavivirga aquatica TaxID=1849968 RepID=A0A1E5T957_9FLAO|nr:DUF389 domain-containing protein [Flavivirga aquatica]OEK07912.1 hypothetical protein A8C32_15660 [Flavivirga aquatica]
MEESKFNFSEEEAKKEKTVEQSKQAIKDDAKGLFESGKQFIKEIFDFRDDTDRDATIIAIKNDIPLKGATAWILIFAIFVASIGLNLSSTAVVIGAMLISPLMGPILGVGMSLAINDIDTLKSSFINLFVMVFLSVLTAYLYFSMSPLTELTPELEARTSPNILDVFIAIFGGLALIVARTKKGTIASVIFGVAIATALMPPLCTAGYGLAVWNIEYFFGAMYLFTINTVFIALATFVVLKVLRFPMQKYVNSKKRKRIAQLAAFAAVIAMIPAIMTFITLLKETGINGDYKNFVKKEIEANDNLWLQRNKIDIAENKISLFFNGEIDKATRTDLINELKGYENIKDFELTINANESRSTDELSKSLNRAFDDLDKKDNIISGLQKEIENLKEEINSIQKGKGNVNFPSLAKDAKIRFKGLESFSYATMLESKDFIKIDTINVVTIRWNGKEKNSSLVTNEKKLSDWLKQELKLKTILIKRVVDK